VSRIVLSGEPLIDGATALRPWREADLAAIVAACQDREISRWTRVPFPYGQEDARAFLLARHDAIHAGTMAPFAIVMSAGDTQLLGSISLMDIDWDHRRAQVGYWLARQARGHGHATRAVGLICRWGFDALGLERIELLAATQNRASQRVAERAGFTREALRDMIAYGLLATDAPGGLLRAS
jgi:RimJ/RimL family protein N-acetyltransferase